MERDVRGYVRVTNMRFEPQNADAAIERFWSVSAPIVLSQDGAISIVGGINRETGVGVALSFWTSVEALQMSNAAPAIFGALPGYAPWMSGGYTVETYDLVRGEPIPRETSTGLTARIFTVAADEHTGAQAIETLDAWISVSGQQRGCVATLLLAPHMGAKVVAVELWRSARAIAVGDARILAELDRGTPFAGRVSIEQIVLS